MDEQRMFLVDIAALMGWRMSTVRNYRDQGRMPVADGYQGNRPWWRESTIEKWRESLPGRGVGGGRPRKKDDHPG